MSLKPVLSLLFISILFIISCSEQEKRQIEVKDEEGNLIEVYEIRLKDSAKVGTYKKFYADGNTYEEGIYRDGVLNGTRKLYYPSGKIQTEENYVDGYFEGKWVSFWENGNKKLEGEYMHNAMEGEWEAFYEEGSLKEVVTFMNNLENGPFIEYYPNRKIKAKGFYKDGDQENGELLLYNEIGELIKKMDCTLGICKTTWSVKDSTDIKL